MGDAEYIDRLAVEIGMLIARRAGRDTDAETTIHRLKISGAAIEKAAQYHREGIMQVEDAEFEKLVAELPSIDEMCGVEGDELEKQLSRIARQLGDNERYGSN